VGVKHRSWAEVAQAVYGREDKATVNKVKIQWKSLRDAFVKHQRKRKAAKTRVRPYLYEDEMRFLLPHILLRECDDDHVPVRNFDVKTEDGAGLTADFRPEAEPQPRAADAAERLPWERSRPEDAHPVDAFFHGVAQTVKQLRPATVARLKKAVANIVMDAELEEIEDGAKIERGCAF
ncbi:uncharacterized protein BDFB_014733, partial [Asbolus verrucosus]